MKKVEEKELEKLQQLNSDFVNAKTQLGDLEIQKSFIIGKVEVIRGEFAKLEEELLKKYGENSVINLQTGEIKKKNNMAKISNTLSYPNQSPIEGADYLIGTAANSSPIDKQTKTFTIQGIADFVIDSAFDGVSYRLPVFTASASGVASVKLVNSLIYQNTASDGTDPSDVVGTTVYINDGNGVGSLIVAQDISATNAACNR